MNSENVRKIFEVFDYMEVNNVTKQSEKIRLLEGLKDKEIEMDVIIDLVLSNLKNFQFSEETLYYPAMSGTLNKQEKTFDQFLELCEKLSSRAISGNDRINETTDFLYACNALHVKWYRRILLKNLRIGIGAELFARVFSHTPIPYKVMLAKPFKDIKDPDSEIKPGFWAERKVDGFRLLTFVERNSIEYWSRNMLSYTQFIGNFFDPIIRSLGDRCNGFVLDGELFNGNISDTQALRRDNVGPDLVKRLKYYLFDIIPIGDFRNQKCDIPQATRKQLLTSLLANYTGDVLINMPHEEITSIEEVQRLTDKYISEGFEGSIIKDPNCPYQFGKRTCAWVKVKRFYTLDLRCTRLERSTTMRKVEYNKKGEKIGMSNELTLGKIFVEYGGVETGVGSGFTQVQRDKWIDKPDDIIGKIVEVSYQEIGKLGGLRFPVFKMIRVDKDEPDVFVPTNEVKDAPKIPNKKNKNNGQELMTW